MVFAGSFVVVAKFSNGDPVFIDTNNNASGTLDNSGILINIFLFIRRNSILNFIDVYMLASPQGQESLFEIILFL